MQAHLLPQIDCSSRALAPLLSLSLQPTTNVPCYASTCTPAGSGSVFSASRFARSTQHIPVVVEMRTASIHGYTRKNRSTDNIAPTSQAVKAAEECIKTTAEQQQQR